LYRLKNNDDTENVICFSTSKRIEMKALEVLFARRDVYENLPMFDDVIGP